MTQQNQPQKKGFVRHHPKINTCFPFCCFSKKSGLLITAILVIILHLVDIYKTQVNVNEYEMKKYITFVIDGIIIMIHILLLFGILENDISYFKPFEFIYGIYIIFAIGIFLLIIGYGIGEGIDDLLSEYINAGESAMFSFVFVFCCIFILVCYVYYYFAVLSYKEDIKEELYYIEQQKELEENNPEVNDPKMLQQ
eukprot:jgi/Orpsp1_1/1182096/evm.model.c7180000079886.1